jgi:phenylacetate-CoA ligase
MNPPVEEKHRRARAVAQAHLQEFEGLDRRGIVAWQVDRLDETLQHCARNSPFYRRRLAAAGHPGRLGGLAEVTGIPFTVKQDLRHGYPFEFLAVPRGEIVRYGESTGTTGAPTSAFITYEDWVCGNVGVEQALGRWFSPGDLVFIAIPYELTFASYDIDRALEALGVTVVAVGALNQVCPFERVVEMMHRLKPTAIVCTPTRALRLYDLSRSMGYDPRGAELETILYVGETCAEAKLRRIARMWDVQLINAYGSTETNSLALPCRAGRLHLTEDRHYFEIIDPVTGDVLPHGSRGELVLTSLLTRAMPLLRYRTGDLATISEEPCECGARSLVLAHSGRVDERFVVGGTVIQRIDLEQLILSFEGLDTYYVSDTLGDTLLARVVPVDPSDRDVCREIERAIVTRFCVRAEVAPISREILDRAMDRMLKPGSLSMKDLGPEAREEIVR